MNIKSMTIHEALAELKVLDRRINSRISESKFIVANKHSNQKINGVSIEAFIENGKTALQSVLDLMDYRKAIRNALSQSNAATKIIVAGKEYTVAEAIEMKKNGIELYRNLGYAINSQSQKASMECTSANRDLDARADNYVSGLVGTKDKSDIDKASGIRDKYIEANTVEVVAVPNVVETAVSALEEYDEFMSEVDARISISNALTTIKVEW